MKKSWKFPTHPYSTTVSGGCFIDFHWTCDNMWMLHCHPLTLQMPTAPLVSFRRRHHFQVGPGSADPWNSLQFASQTLRTNLMFAEKFERYRRQTFTTGTLEGSSLTTLCHFSWRNIKIRNGDVPSNSSTTRLMVPTCWPSCGVFTAAGCSEVSSCLGVGNPKRPGWSKYGNRVGFWKAQKWWWDGF